jgi:hypothetical protein
LAKFFIIFGSVIPDRWFLFKDVSIFLASHTKVAMVTETALVRLFSPAFDKVTSDLTLSVNLVRVMVLAVALIALSISSKIPVSYGLSLGSIQIGIAAGAAARILPIRKPFENGLSRQFGIPKLSLLISAAQVFASRASLRR